jgi:3-hydroxyisobutyrate dehydrogenase-like beta-hydroxyacid dehydrogenase
VETVGVVGVGIMGARVARNLLKAGYPVVVYDPAAAAVEPLVDDGAEAAAGAGDAAARVDVLFLSLPDSPQVLAVAEDVAASGRDGLVVFDLSTVAPSTPQKLAAELAPRGITWLDAPVSGGPSGAENATLTIMIGGDEAAVERCRPVLQTIGRNVEYMGPSGMGATTKLVNQLAIGIQMVAMFEAFTLGVKAGIDARRLWEVLRTSTSRCWVMEELVQKVVLENAFETPRFALRLMHKDLRLAVETASAYRTPAAATALAEQMFAVAEGLGWGERDHMAVIELYANWAGIERW